MRLARRHDAQAGRALLRGGATYALYRDDGKPLGVIARYYEEGATYAWVSLGGMKRERSVTRYFNARRLGACSTDQAARAAVEQALGEVGS
jgi:hypothetical protein